MCLCDGAGSASHAEVGARVMAAAVVAALGEVATTTRESLEAALRGACEAGRATLVREAANLSVAPSALACTLIAVVCAGDLVGIAHVGDGAVVAQRAGAGEFVVLSRPDRGEYVNETWFVTSAEWQAHLRIGVHEDITALCVFTDGCQEASLVHDVAFTPFEPFFGPLFEFAGAVTDVDAADLEVKDLLAGSAMRRMSGDDKTLAVCRRQTPA